MDKQITGVDIFAGAGGMSLGAEMSGIKVVCAVEKDKYAAETYQENHISTIMLNEDIYDIMNLPGIEKNEIDIFFGGAPCQGFSLSNRRTNNSKNPTNWLYKEFIRMLKLYHPKWFVFENVTGLLELESGIFFQNMLMDFEQVGYTCSSAVLNAMEYGIPQRRNRLFVVGSICGKKVNLKDSNNYPLVSVIEAIGDLPQLENGANIDVLPYYKLPESDYARMMRGNMVECSGNLVSKNSKIVLERYKYIRQGQNWSAVPKELMKSYKDSSQCHTGIYYRLLENQPAVVIGNYRKSMLIHPTQDRGLSVCEAARLQSFPDKYVFKGGLDFDSNKLVMLFHRY